MFRRKIMTLQRIVETLEIIDMKQGDTLGSNDVLILIQRFIVGQGQHEFCQFFVIALFHQNVANASDLIWSEYQRLRTFSRFIRR